ncbi:hypothetical protein IFO69_01400 [Echinicola sp. CAU 1574]|uniref:Uncharacterized protein n=1 Tax=Echinicola arenosa TaxID=2774144 RepID=A0ABR9AF05_9BACT|nr:hypothetical protein [Echinicola arenosa]MBD8487392.1 hypothetical protein [Echinicola arenosa]
MKTKIYLLTISIILLAAFNVHAQTDSIAISLEKSLKNSLLKSIQVKTDSMDNQLGTKLSDLDQKIQMLDESLNQTSSETQKIEKLIERVKLIEDFQQAEKDAELNIYQGNYQSAIINLVAMERELRPLILFGATRDFFQTLNSVGNPTSYPGFNEWYSGFKSFVDKNKKESPTLSVVANLISLTGDLSAGTPIFGTFSQALFTGMSSYIESIGTGKRDKKLRDQSQEMFELVAELGQFTNDKNLIETEWEAIDTELEELKKLYEENLDKNLKILDIGKKEFERRYSKENDANLRYEYLNELTNIIARRVKHEKETNPKNWKNTFYNEMSEIQSLKIRFGSITFRISENINKYNSLIDKYKEAKHIGPKINDLESKLNNLKNAFDKAFNPLEYINAANKMYKVD